MDKLVKDILNLSQYDSGFFQLQRVDFELIVFLQELLHKYLNVLTERDITVTLKFPDACYVNGDLLRIEQVILNMHTNAINHVDAKKEIIVQVTTAENVRLSIYNSGLPIPDDSLEKYGAVFIKWIKQEHGSTEGTAWVYPLCGPYRIYTELNMVWKTRTVASGFGSNWTELKNNTIYKIL